ncbi:hypothetical protein B9Z55_008162 [Caenorhabditis nigoni]|uniref:Uncharacterized protein n=1 Tax=Caenorhabditis nigoni TaxID=1611254 RepID=A0A2G5VCX0_9PELO|nr:hypothetical protein B9Z55_008162 [Caenorhabditis nigoni]
MSKLLYAFLFSVIFLVLMVQGSMKSDGVDSEEPTKEEMKEVISKLMENRSKHYRSQKGPHYCGGFAVKKIEEVCPNFCTVDDGK